MSEENQVPPESSTSSADSWQEVGRQFQTLGASLAQTVRTAWENEETQRRLQEMRTGLESMVREVGDAIDDVAKSPQGQQIRQDANRAAEAVRGATEQTVQEVRPQLINALQQLNEELQKLVSRMETRPPQSGAEGTSAQNPPPGDPQI
jgi:gas vesicle protein